MHGSFETRFKKIVNALEEKIMSEFGGKIIRVSIK